MPACLLTRLASLFLFLTMLAAGQPAAAADGGAPYVRAISKGRVAVHRPNYRPYRGSRPQHGRLYRLLHR